MRIIFAGPLLNYILAFFIFSFVSIIGFPTLTSTIGKVLPDYPADVSGIKAGDKILEVNGHEINYWEDVTRRIHTNKEGLLNLVIERDSKVMDIIVKPRREEVKTVFGSKKRVGIIGIMPADEMVYVKYGIIESIYMGFKKLITLTYITYRALWASLTGAISFKDSVTGPIGIFYITGQAARLGFVYLLHLIGILSASLAIFNLLPVPILDGGHLFFLMIEKLRKKPLSYKLQESITQVAFVALISLMLFVFYNDFMRYDIMDKIVKFWQK